MTLETLRKFYDLVTADFNHVELIWHGGEPLLMGTDFYRSAVAMQKEYPHVIFRNGMQSNLTLVDASTAACLNECRIHIGSSLDGVCNDILRGHTDEILGARKQLAENGIPCGFIMVVSKRNIDSLTESYQFFKETGVNYTMNLYVPSGGQADQDLRLDPEYSVRKICEFFDLWMEDTDCNIHLSYFEQFVEYWFTGKKTVCKYNSCLGRWAAVRWDGEIVPCNRFFPKQYSLGNIWDYTSFREVFNSNGFKKLLKESVQRRKKCSSHCSIYDLCEGGCNHVALSEGGIAYNGGPSCQMLIGVFNHVSKRMEEVSQYGKVMGLNPYIVDLAQAALAEK